MGMGEQTGEFHDTSCTDASVLGESAGLFARMQVQRFERNQMNISRFVLPGMLVAAACLGGCTMMDKEGKEVKVPAEQLPAAVRETFAKESGGATIKEADKEQADGKTV